MTTLKQLLQTSPAKANELLAKLADTSDSAIKMRDRVFADLKAELDLLARLEEEHLFPALRKHKEAKDFLSAALNGNKEIRRLVAELERAPKESGEFAAKAAELRKVFQQSVRDERNELLPAVLKALGDDEAQAIVRHFEAGRAEIEEARRAEAEQHRAKERHEREHAAQVLAEQQREAAEREHEAREAARRTAAAVARTGEVAAENSRKIVEGAAESGPRLATAPLSTGSIFWDAMFGMWAPQHGRSLARTASPEVSTRAEEVIPLAEETLVVGKRTVESGTTRVRRYVVETPVEKQVSLYDERVVVERRRPVTAAGTGETLTEVTIEMVETSEQPIVGKSVQVREEVVVRRERTERVATVRDTVRRDEIEVEHSERNEPARTTQPALASSGR